jgi:cell division protein ZapE
MGYRSNKDLRRRYAGLVKQGKLAPDMAQEMAVERLHDLHGRLGIYAKALRRRGMLTKVFMRLGLYKSAPAPRGIYLCGDVGRGKSMLMDLFFEIAPLKPRRRVHFHEFMLETHEQLHRERRRLASRPATKKQARSTADPITPVAARIARTAKLLCFDEFQVNDITDAMILGRLFSALYAKGVVVVATSNRMPDALYEGGLNRQLFLPFLALFKDRQEIIQLGGEIDYRQEKTEDEEGVYFTPLDERARQRLEQAFVRLIRSRSAAPRALPIAQGRILNVSSAVDGVARFSFAELCERPLGSADYLALAETYHTLVIDGIPRLGPEKRNEARRFITLIDTLYEKRIRLIASAAVPPEQLYEKGDGISDFARTVSRLVEMQSADYLAEGRRGADN